MYENIHFPLRFPFLNCAFSLYSTPLPTPFYQCLLSSQHYPGPPNTNTNPYEVITLFYPLSQKNKPKQKINKQTATTKNCFYLNVKSLIGLFKSILRAILCYNSTYSLTGTALTPFVFWSFTKISMEGILSNNNRFKWEDIYALYSNDGEIFLYSHSAFCFAKCFLIGYLIWIPMEKWQNREKSPISNMNFNIMLFYKIPFSKHI